MIQVLISLLPVCAYIVLGIGQMLGGTGELPPEARQWAESLHLTQDQIVQIQTVETDYADAIAQFYQQLQQFETDLTDLMVSDASVGEVRQKEREFEALKLQAAQVYFEKFLDIRSILTPSQLQGQCAPYSIAQPAA